MSYFDHKRVFITGGSSGIGLATAKCLVQQGSDIAIVARNIPRLDRAWREIKALCIRNDQQVIAMPVDVTKPLHIRKCAQKIMEQWDRIDLLINNAGISRPGYLHQIPDETWENTMDVNYRGTVHTTLAFLPYFMRQRSGHIANVTSVLGFMGLFGYGPYSASKFAVVGFSECLRQDLLPYHVRVTVYYPPDTDTPLFHEEEKTKPRETRALAGTIRVMSSEKAAEHLLKGIEKQKFTVVPGLMTKIICRLHRHFPSLFRYMLDKKLMAYPPQEHAGLSGVYQPGYGR